MDGRQPESPRVGVVRGGWSGEREISLQSGESVLAALQLNQQPSVDITIDRDRRWRVGDEPPAPLARAIRSILEQADLLFIALHGSFGEDGVVQGFFDSIGLPYVGSGVTPSGLAMDKLLSRRVAITLGIDVAKGVEFGPTVSPDLLDQISRAGLELPWFVKPSASGSSVGVTRVEDPARLLDAAKSALAYDRRGVIESGIVGIELSCPVLGDAHTDAKGLPVIEIVPKNHAFFDYEAKYAVGATDEICPARIEESSALAAQRAAVALHDAFGCLDLSRSDFILTPEGKLVFLEINTLPGLTPMSLFPKAAAACGLSYAEFIDGLLRHAWQRHRANHVDEFTTKSLTT